MYVVRISLKLYSGRVLIGWVQQHGERLDLTDIQNKGTRFSSRKAALDVALLAISEIDNGQKLDLEYQIYAIRETNGVAIVRKRRRKPE